MLPAVNFNDEAGTEADEIANEWAERHLATKLEIREAPITQGEPEFALGIGHLRAQPPCTRCCD